MPNQFAFDWTINLGQVITVISFVGGLWLASLQMTRRLTRFEDMVERHAYSINEHSSKLTVQDGSILKLVGDVQRLIGRLDAMTDRRHIPRNES